MILVQLNLDQELNQVAPSWT